MMGRPMMGQDPRMAQMNQRQNINTGIQQVARPPKESEDTELIQLIKLLTSMGIPMEQLRGRTKDELVEMAVALKGKTQGGRDVTETAEVIEEEDIRAVPMCCFPENYKEFLVGGQPMRDYLKV